MSEIGNSGNSDFLNLEIGVGDQVPVPEDAPIGSKNKQGSDRTVKQKVGHIMNETQKSQDASAQQVVKTAEKREPKIADDGTKRKLALDLQRMLRLYSIWRDDVTLHSRTQVDVVGTAEILYEFYEALRREYEAGIDFKLKGRAGLGHRVTPEIAQALGQNLVRAFGPHLVLDEHLRAALVRGMRNEALNGAQADIADAVDDSTR